MNFFSNLKIRTLIQALTMMVVLCTLLVGIVDINALREQDKQTQAMYSGSIQPTIQIDLVRNATNRYSHLVYRYILFKDEQRRIEVRAAMTESKSQVAQAFAELKKGGMTDVKAIKVADTERAWATYLANAEQVINADATGDDKTAVARLDQLSSDFNSVTTSFGSLVDYNVAQSSALVQESTETYKRGRNTLIALDTVVFVFGALTAFLLARYIGKRLTDLAAAADQIAGGDLDIKLDSSGNSEVAQVAHSFDTMANNIRGVISDARSALDQHKAGNTDALISSDKHSGAYRELSASINGGLSLYVGVLRKLLSVLEEYAEGNFANALEQLPGKLHHANSSLETLRDTLRQLTADIKNVTDAAAQGKLSVRADASPYHGNYKEIIERFNLTLDAVVNPLTDISLVLDTLAAGTLTARVESRYQGDFDRLKKAVNLFAQEGENAIAYIATNSSELSDASGHLRTLSEHISANSEETATQASVVSSASDEVASNVQTVATGAEEMGASIREIAKNTAEATRMAQSAVQSADSATATITKLGQSSTEIGDVIKVITSIAQQTNLLALNATIEAARAGEAGKGFAVVANEVKELAKETAKATEDISRKIEAIQADTESAVAAIAQIGTVIGQINDFQNTIASAVEEQSATTGEIGRNLAEAARSSTDISKNIVGVAEAAKSTTAGVVDIQKSAQDLARMAENLQTMLSRFTYSHHTQAPAALLVGNQRLTHHSAVVQ